MKVAYPHRIELRNFRERNLALYRNRREVAKATL